MKREEGLDDMGARRLERRVDPVRARLKNEALDAIVARGQHEDHDDFRAGVTGLSLFTLVEIVDLTLEVAARDRNVGWDPA